jgi:hypothetical protein
MTILLLFQMLFHQLDIDVQPHSVKADATAADLGDSQQRGQHRKGHAHPHHPGS